MERRARPLEAFFEGEASGRNAGMSYTYTVMTVENAKDRRYDSGTDGKAGQNGMTQTLRGQAKWRKAGGLNYL